MMPITLDVLALMVECPVCGACDIGGDTVEACWNMDGTEREPTHDDRMEVAAEYLLRAQGILQS